MKLNSKEKMYLYIYHALTVILLPASVALAIFFIFKAYFYYKNSQDKKPKMGREE